MELPTIDSQSIKPHIISSKSDNSLKTYNKRYSEYNENIEEFNSGIFEEIYKWELEIKNAKFCQDIFHVFEKLELTKISDRLKELDSLIKDDPYEDDMNLESLKNMAFFVIKNKLSDFMIGTTPNGYIQIEWHLNPNGIVALELLKSNIIRFAIKHPENDSKSEQLEASGILDDDTILCIIKKII